MPEPATLTSTGHGIKVEARDLKKVRLFIEADGNGSAEIPSRKENSIEILKVSRIPGSALGVLATQKAHGIGFTLVISWFSETFDALIVGELGA
jgi:hypothetical protein